MKKRTFLKTSSALVTGSLLSPLTSCSSEEKKTVETMVRNNWAGNLAYSAENFYEPSSIEEMQKVIQDCEKLRVLGTRHCFNTIADSKTNQVSARGLTKILELDEAAQTVTVEGGISYGQLCPWLHERGYALHNLASLPHISIAGACATATHGSGMQNGNLPTAVTAFEFIDAQGQLQTLSREKDGEKFAGAVVHLGALGLFTKITLKVQPTFQMQQDVYQDMPVWDLLDNFETVMGAGYSVSLFTDWQTDKVNQVWIKSQVREGESTEGAQEFFGAKLFDRNVHPILEHSPVNCTEQMGVPGPWYERMPHFKMEFTPSSGKELQAEYFVPLRNSLGAFEAIHDLKEKVGPLLMISEIRSIAADDIWMSPAYGQDSIAFHFTLEQDWPNVQKLLPLIEETLDDLGGRPHWGKMFTMSPERLQSRYSKLADFKALAKEYDPKGKFVNGFLEKHLWT